MKPQAGQEMCGIHRKGRHICILVVVVTMRTGVFGPEWSVHLDFGKTFLHTGVSIFSPSVSMFQCPLLPNKHTVLKMCGNE